MKRKRSSCGTDQHHQVVVLMPNDEDDVVSTTGSTNTGHRSTTADTGAAAIATATTPIITDSHHNTPAHTTAAFGSNKGGEGKEEDQTHPPTKKFYEVVVTAGTAMVGPTSQQQPKQPEVVSTSQPELQQQPKQPQQHPKILGYFLFSPQLRNLQQQHSPRKTGAMNHPRTLTTMTSVATGGSNDVHHTDRTIDVNTTATTTTTTTHTPFTSELLPIILQRIYDHSPSPIYIQPVTDDELVRYTMASVTAIRNSDVPQLRAILQVQQQQEEEELMQQQQQPLVITPSNNNINNDEEMMTMTNKKTNTKLSWFDGRNRNGESLLHLACRRSTVEVVQFLIHEALVNVYVTDLNGRTCLHDICWRPRVEEALPIFNVVHEQYMNAVHRVVNDKEETESSLQLLPVDHKPSSASLATTAAAAATVALTTTSTVDSIITETKPVTRQHWLQTWPLQSDIRGHVCFDYCRQEHWYEWNTYLVQLQEQQQQDNQNAAVAVERKDNGCVNEMKSERWCTIV